MQSANICQRTNHCQDLYSSLNFVLSQTFHSGLLVITNGQFWTTAGWYHWTLDWSAFVSRSDESRFSVWYSDDRVWAWSFQENAPYLTALWHVRFDSFSLDLGLDKQRQFHIPNYVEPCRHIRMETRAKSNKWACWPGGLEPSPQSSQQRPRAKPSHPTSVYDLTNLLPNELSHITIYRLLNILKSFNRKVTAVNIVFPTADDCSFVLWVTHTWITSCLSFFTVF